MAVSRGPAADDAAERIWFTQIAGASLVDSRGERLGRVDDVIARLGDGVYPPVTGVVGRIGRRRVFIPEARVSKPEEGTMRLVGETLNLLSFERRQGEVLLGADVVGRRVISVEAGRLVTAHDVAIAKSRGAWRLVGIDIRARSMLRRLLPGSRRSAPHPDGAFLDWANVQPFVGHVPGSRLLLPLRPLRRLHPAQIADLVEAASHDEGEEIISAVHGDPELEADVFEELDAEHQVEFLRDRSDDEAAMVLAGMNADDAADLITDLDQERRAPILNMLPVAQQAKVRALLSYNPQSAGGLMSPDFVAVPETATAGAALDAVRQATLPPQLSADVFLVDGEGRLKGAVAITSLLRTGPDTPVASLAERGGVSVEAADDFPEVARRMADYNLTVAPVVDHEDRVIGAITVDDVLEAMLPDSWRRRAEASGD
jgi:MgtE intracellular N domain/CBS domain